jgi:ABC-type cobalamin/Fe3+-siderophores transport system ATPase subunit
MEVMYLNKISNNYFNNKSFVGFIGEEQDLSVLIPNYNEIKINQNKKVKQIIKKDEGYFHALNLNPIFFNKRIKDLSSYEYKCVLLLKIVASKPELIILNNLDLGINDREKARLSNFIKTLNATLNINFIVLSNDVLFQNFMCKHYIIMKNRIIKYQGDLINAIKQKLVPKPEIIKFVDLANSKKNVNLDYYLDNKELLKAIYRSVF